MRWVLAAVKLRKADIVRRMSLQKRSREHREDAIQKEQLR